MIELSELPAAPERFVLKFDGKGGATEVEREPSPDDVSFHWIHLNWEDEGAEATMADDLGIESFLITTLLAGETRPRSMSVQDGRELLILRGVNLAPGAEPEDMVSLRVLIGPDRVITLARRRLRTVDALRHMLLDGKGPATASSFLAAIIELLVDFAHPVVVELGDQIDELEDRVLEGETRGIELELGPVRQRLVKLRRYLAPQRDALARLLTEPAPWMNGKERTRIREAADQLTRQVEDLDAYRDRGKLVQEEITYRANQQLNRNAFILTAAAGVLLPLNLLTGLFGMNVGGIPGKDWPLAFGLICIICLVFVGLAVLIGRRRGLW